MSQKFSEEVIRSKNPGPPLDKIIAGIFERYNIKLKDFPIKR